MQEVRAEQRGAVRPRRVAEQGSFACSAIRDGEAGLTLVELIITVAILALSITARLFLRKG